MQAKICGKRTQQPTCSLAEADLDVVQVAGGGRGNDRRCQRCCCMVADGGQHNESRLARQEQVVVMLLHVQRTKERAVMSLCGRQVVDNAMRASGIVFVAQVASGG